MKASSRRTSQTKYYTQLAVVTVSAAMLLFFLPRAVYFTASLVMAPINGVKTWVAESSASLPQYLRNRSELVDELTELRQRVAERGGDRFTLDMLAKENAELRALMGDVDDERILSGVIGRPSTLPYDMLMLDRGSVHGVVEGAPVYIGDRTVIGFVQSVSERTSLVTLITTPGFTSTVYVLGPDIYTTAVGLGGGQLRVSIPQGFVVKEGDLVILPSVTSGVYGSVSYIETIPTQPEQFAYVSPKTPIASLRLVAVGKTSMQGSTFDAAVANVTAALNELFEVSVPSEFHATSTNPLVGGTTTATSSEEVHE